jgi:hypothetical protein
MSARNSDPETVQSVSTVPDELSISISVLPVLPTSSPSVVALAPVNVTVPKSANLTRELPDS